jgi:hypothetical protein
MTNGYLSLCLLLLHFVVPFTAASPVLLGTEGLIFALGFGNVNPSDEAARSAACSLQLGYGQMAISNRPCVYGLCALLNETSISCARPMNFMSNSAYTVAAWLSPFVNQFFPGTLTFFNVFSSDTNAAHQFGIQSFTGMYPSTFANVPRLYVNDDFQYYLNGSSFEFPFVWNPTEWTHVAFVFDGAYVRLYINATLQSAFIGPTDMSITSNSYSFNVGSPSRQTYGLIPYQGLIDELGVFNIALNQSQINDLFNVAGTSASTSTPTSASTSTPTTAAPAIMLTSAPVTDAPSMQQTNALSPALFAMAGRVGSFGFNAPPLDGTGSPCSFIPGFVQLLSTSQCIFGTCVLLNETKISCIEPSSGWPTNTSGEYTVAAWLSPYVAAPVTGTMIFFHVVDANNNSIGFGINSFGAMFPQSNYNTPQLLSNGFPLFYTNGTAHAFPFVQAVGVWTHVAFVSVGGFVRIYINATLQSTFIAGEIQPIRQLPLTFNIGSKLDSDMQSTIPFQGIIDELGVFNIALSQSQIEELYNGANLTPVTTTSAPSSASTAVPSTASPSTTLTAAPSTASPSSATPTAAPSTASPSSATPTAAPSSASHSSNPSASPTHVPTHQPSSAPTDAASSSSSTLDKMSDFFTDTTVLMVVFSIVALAALVFILRCLCAACHCCVYSHSSISKTPYMNVPTTG